MPVTELTPKNKIQLIDKLINKGYAVAMDSANEIEGMFLSHICDMPKSFLQIAKRELQKQIK
jgi:hypothetical protein